MASGGSSSKTLAVLGFIIGAAGLGLSGYVFYMYGQELASLKSNIEERSSVHRTWYVQASDPFYTNPSLTYLDVPLMLISFQVDEGESVYFLFTCYCKIDRPSIVSTNLVKFYFEVDGYRQDIDSGALNFGETGDEYYTIPLQYVNNTLSSGPHSVQVLTYGYDDDNAIIDRTLLVQTFIP